jgi:hypothetical protein
LTGGFSATGGTVLVETFFFVGFGDGLRLGLGFPDGDGFGDGDDEGDDDGLASTNPIGGGEP